MLNMRTLKQNYLGINNRMLGMVFIGTLVLALSAKVTVPLYPAAVTLQSLVVLLMGMLGGWRYGVATVLAYLIEGLAGLPVFVAGVGPSFGYLLGFVPAVFLAGVFQELGWCDSTAKTFVSGLLATSAIYLIGVPVLATFVGIHTAFTLGVLPFLLGDGLKLIFISLVVPGFHRVFERSLQ